jgi:hypothetical protein
MNIALIEVGVGYYPTQRCEAGNLINWIKIGIEHHVELEFLTV